MLHKKIENCLMREYSKRKLDYIRSSHPEVFCKKGVLRNFAKLTGKCMCQSLFLNKIAGLSTFCRTDHLF